MPNDQPGAFVRIVRGAWRALDFSRRLVVNLIFLAIVVFVLSLLLARHPPLASRTTLVLDPEGTIVEQYTLDPTQRALENLSGGGRKQVQLRDLLRVIDAATRDSAIERIALVPDGIDGVGYATLRELGAALDRFRAAGKDVVAVSNGMTQQQYLLAAHASSILLDPEGSVLLEGLANYRSYFKTALDKLGVDVHLIRVGQYKSAAEPLILDAASAASKEEDSYWLGGIWQDYLAEVGKLRQIDPAGLTATIDQYGAAVTAHAGDLAKLALEQKLVDRIATRAEAREYLRSVGAPAGKHGFRQIEYGDYLAMVGEQPAGGANGTVAVVVAEGEIASGDQPPGAIGGRSTAALVRAAREDDSVKAVVLRVNSPGGDAFASEEIRREVAAARAAGKPVYVSMGDVAASGGYWISMDGTKIYADPTTITGSIGIFGLFVSIPDALDKLGIHTDGVGTTPIADPLDVRRPMSPEVESVLTSVIDRGYRQFVGKVASARGKSPEQVDAIAQGRVWTGRQALERGLVDQLGDLHDAIAAAAAEAGLGNDYAVRYVERPMSPWQRVLLDIGNDSALAGRLPLPASVLAAWLPQADWRAATTVASMLRTRPYAVFAQCFCGLR